MLRQSFLFFILVVTVTQINALKLKTYYLNKYNISYEKRTDYDCLENQRKNISIPKTFTLCYRHKIMNLATFNLNNPSWTDIFIGNYEQNTTKGSL